MEGGERECIGGAQAGARVRVGEKEREKKFLVAAALAKGLAEESAGARANDEAQRADLRLEFDRRRASHLAHQVRATNHALRPARDSWPGTSSDGAGPSRTLRGSNASQGRLRHAAGESEDDGGAGVAQGGRAGTGSGDWGSLLDSAHVDAELLAAEELLLATNSPGLDYHAAPGHTRTQRSRLAAGVPVCPLREVLPAVQLRQKSREHHGEADGREPTESVQDIIPCDKG